MNRKKTNARFLTSNTANLLVFVLLLRITSYFMLSDSVFITQVFKVGFRLFVTTLTAVLFLIQYRKRVVVFLDVVVRHSRMPRPMQ